MRFAAVYQRAEANWAGYVPDCPTCVATGQTLDQVQKQLTEAVEVHLSTLRSQGLNLPTPETAVGYLEVEPPPLPGE
ncbi:MAG: type II toxin-antitoxin system HicB family antitoxin [Armatimonadia bacterium]|jgi:predicted RNase H-like HicB family nuclease|nr:type II toxin-antitoxin system HicB family antitoxin [Armatimonadia bacterium]